MAFSSSISRGHALVAVAALGAPLSAQYLSTAMSVSFQLYMISSRARRGEAEEALAAFGLAGVACSLTAHCALWGLGSGADTLVTQAYGRNDSRAVGRTFVRCVAVLWCVACAPGTALFWRSGTLLRARNRGDDERFDGAIREDTVGGVVRAGGDVRESEDDDGDAVYAESGGVERFDDAAEISGAVGLRRAFARRGASVVEGAAWALTTIDFGTMTMYVTAFVTSKTCRDAMREVRVFADACSGRRTSRWPCRDYS